jgi:PAS domain S-box-containing protein
MPESKKGQQENGQFVPTRRTCRSPALEIITWGHSAFCALFCVASLAIWGGALDISTSYARDSEVNLFKIAACMLLPAIMLEGSHLLSTLCERKLDLRGKWVVLFLFQELIIKLFCYSSMWFFRGALVHRNYRLKEQIFPVYTVRFMDWFIAVPALVGLTLMMFEGDHDPVSVRRIAPSLACNLAYVVCAFVGQIVPNNVAGWALMGCCAVSFTLYIIHQAMFVYERCLVTNHATFKVWSVIVKDIVFVVYAIVAFGEVAGFVPHSAAQLFFTFADVILKTASASVLSTVRYWDLELAKTKLVTKVAKVEDDMHRMISDASTPMVCLNKLGVVMAWNRKLEEVTGVTSKNARGKRLSQLVVPECTNDVVGAVESVENKGKTGVIEIMFDFPGCPRAHMAMNFIARFGEVPGSTSIVGVGQDMTELIASKAMQEQRDRFTAIMSHELKGPLHGIAGLSSGLADQAEDPLNKKQMSMIHGCANRLLDLVANVMTQSTQENADHQSNKLNDPKRVNFLNIIDEVVTMITASIDKAGKPLVRPKVQLVNNATQEKAPLVLGDPYKCTQVLYNLISNACKFTKEGYVRIDLKHSSGDGEICIEVADTGCGIPAESLGRIFKPYQQVVGGDAASFQGVGLGLSVAMGIAHMHGGTIKVTSELGVGSTFSVHLPCTGEDAPCEWSAEETERSAPSQPAKPNKEVKLDVPPKPAQDEKAAPLAKRAPPILRSTEEVEFVDLSEMSDILRQFQWAFANSSDDEGAKPLILSVDDDEVNHLVIESKFGSDFRIVQAMDGFEAVKYLRSGKEMPFIVLLDIMMPGMTGFEVAREIRNTIKVGHMVLPVIMLSARSPIEETSNESFISGATDFMPKPFNARELNQKIRIVQEQRSSCLHVYKKVMQLCNSQSAPATCPAMDSQELSAAKDEVVRLTAEVARLDKESEAKIATIQKSLEDTAAANLKAEQEKAAKSQQEERQRREAQEKELANAKAEAARLKDEVNRVKSDAESQVKDIARRLHEQTTDKAHLEQQQVSASVDGAAAEAGDSANKDLTLAHEEIARLTCEVSRVRDEADERVRSLQKRMEEQAAREAKLGSSLTMPKALKEAALELGSPRDYESSVRSMRSEDTAFHDKRITRELSWLREDREKCEKSLSEFAEKMAQSHIEALMQQLRADASSREVMFLKSEVSHLRSQLEENSMMIECLQGS